MSNKKKKSENSYIEALKKGDVAPEMTYSQYGEKIGIHLDESHEEVVKKVKILEEYPRG